MFLALYILGYEQVLTTVMWPSGIQETGNSSEHIYNLRYGKVKINIFLTLQIYMLF